MGHHTHLRTPRRIEARLWTGPLAHLLGGALDVLSALGRVGLRHTAERLRALSGREKGRPA